MKLMVVTVDGKIIQSSIIIPKGMISTMCSRLARLWWVSEVYPVAH